MPQMNAAGLALLKSSEGLSLTAYADPVGVETIGYGHTGDVWAGETITQDQAQKLLESDLEPICASIQEFCLVELTPNQFAALVDFAYNLGIQALRDSTLMVHVNAGNFDAAIPEFGKWVYAGGRVLEGLVTRRAAEAKLFAS